MTEVESMNRAFSWHMLSSTKAGWEFALITEIHRMLELMPDPEMITIRMERPV